MRRHIIDQPVQHDDTTRVRAYTHIDRVTGDAAAEYAAREEDYTQQARAAGLAGGPVRAVTPLALWRGILFLEYVPGLTVNDVIAVRRSRPGTLLPTLERVVELLAQLHAGAQRPDEPPDFSSPLAYAHKLIDNLEKYGVLQRDPLVAGGLRRLVDRWADDPTMVAYTPALTHGDATTTNFILAPQGDLVAIDWERAKVVDPAADVGRLLAEVAHSIARYGGAVAEALPILARLQDTYCRAMASRCDPEPLQARIRFYQASSTLRIARNGWLSRLERTALVAQAMALLG